MVGQTRYVLREVANALALGGYQLLSLTDQRLVVASLLLKEAVMRQLRRSADDRRGQSTSEYALILCLVAIVIVAVMMVLGERVSDTASTATGALGDPEEQKTLRVNRIRLTLTTGTSVEAEATIRVKDDDGRNVRGAIISVTWSVNGGSVGTDSGGTDRGGKALISYESDELGSGDVVAVTVTNISKAGYDYSPNSNLETSKQVTVP